MKVFVDTWGWLVLEDRHDPAHPVVKRLMNTLQAGGEEVFTSDYVLDETTTRLFQRRPFPEAKRFVEGVLESAERGYVSLERVDAKRFQDAWVLRLRYEDQPGISFTDFTSFAVMRQLKIVDALTQDRHFRIAGFNVLP